MEMRRLVGACNAVRWENPALRADSLDDHPRGPRQPGARRSSAKPATTSCWSWSTSATGTSRDHSYGVRTGGRGGQWTQVLCTQDADVRRLGRRRQRLPRAVDPARRAGLHQPAEVERRSSCAGYDQKRQRKGVTCGVTVMGMDGHVLVVEDDASIREVTALGLARAGLRVSTAVDGRAGPGGVARAGVRPDRAGRDAAGPGRLRGVPGDPPIEPGSDPHGRPPAPTRSTSWSGWRRRRRLRAQAVRAARAGGPGACAAAAHVAAPMDGDNDDGRRARDRPGAFHASARTGASWR